MLDDDKVYLRERRDVLTEVQTLSSGVCDRPKIRRAVPKWLGPQWPCRSGRGGGGPLQGATTPLCQQPNLRLTTTAALILRQRHKSRLTDCILLVACTPGRSLTTLEDHCRIPCMQDTFDLNIVDLNKRFSSCLSWFQMLLYQVAPLKHGDAADFAGPAGVLLCVVESEFCDALRPQQDRVPTTPVPSRHTVKQDTLHSTDYYAACVTLLSHGLSTGLSWTSEPPTADRYCVESFYLST